MKEVSLDLFLLMSNLAQIDKSETLLRIFTEAINSMVPGFSIGFEQDLLAEGPGVMEVRTLGNHFGVFRLSGDPCVVHPDFCSLLQNAVQMLAVIMERNLHQSRLSDESQRLQVLVGEKVASIRRSEALLNDSQALAHVGGWEWDQRRNTMYWTRECCRIHDMEPDEVPQESKELVDISLACYRPEDQPLIKDAFIRCTRDGIPYDLKFPFRTTKGRHIWIHTTARAVGEPGNIERVVGNIMDISEEVAAERALRTSLEEKEALVRELYHRTNNNMNVICSMLELKSGTLGDSGAIAAFRDMGNRIRAMAMVHSRLYKSRNLSRIDLDEYLKEAVGYLVLNYKPDSLDLDLEFDIQPLNVPFDLAVPVGLFVNEIVTNSFKHAFSGRHHGTIRIELRESADHCIFLALGDDGVGMPESRDPLLDGGLGWMIITAIAQSQLNGELSVRHNPGLRFELSFRNDLYQTHP